MSRATKIMALKFSRREGMSVKTGSGSRSGGIHERTAVAKLKGAGDGHAQQECGGPRQAIAEPNHQDQSQCQRTFIEQDAKAGEPDRRPMAIPECDKRIEILGALARIHAGHIVGDHQLHRETQRCQPDPNQKPPQGRPKLGPRVLEIPHEARGHENPEPESQRRMERGHQSDEEPTQAVAAGAERCGREDE
jgi:hypothetical protein